MGISTLFGPTITQNRVYYAKLLDKKAQGTYAGSFVLGAYRTRELNTIEKNEDSIVVSLSSNQFTLKKGTYDIQAYAPGAYVHTHKARLYNITDSAETLVGSTAYHFNYSINGYSIVQGRFSIAVQKTFELQHETGVTRADYGMGYSQNHLEETYAIVNLWKVE